MQSTEVFAQCLYEYFAKQKLDEEEKKKRKKANNAFDPSYNMKGP